MQLPAEHMELAFERRWFDGQLLRQSEKREITRARRQRLHFPARCAKVRAGYGRAAIPAAGDRYALSLRILGSLNAHGSGLVRARPRGKKSANSTGEKYLCVKLLRPAAQLRR